MRRLFIGVTQRSCNRVQASALIKEATDQAAPEFSQPQAFNNQPVAPLANHHTDQLEESKTADPGYEAYLLGIHTTLAGPVQVESLDRPGGEEEFPASTCLRNGYRATSNGLDTAIWTLAGTEHNGSHVEQDNLVRSKPGIHQEQDHRPVFEVSNSLSASSHVPRTRGTRTGQRHTATWRSRKTIPADFGLLIDFVVHCLPRSVG